MLIEQEFRKFMKQVYPGVLEDSPQFKTSRAVFYSGALITVTSTEEKLRQTTQDLQDALGLARTMALKGIAPEETLADYAEHRGDEG